VNFVLIFYDFQSCVHCAICLFVNVLAGSIYIIHCHVLCSC